MKTPKNTSFHFLWQLLYCVRQGQKVMVQLELVGERLSFPPFSELWFHTTLPPFGELMSSFYLLLTLPSDATLCPSTFKAQWPVHNHFEHHKRCHNYFLGGNRRLVILWAWGGHYVSNTTLPLFFRVYWPSPTCVSEAWAFVNSRASCTCLLSWFRRHSSFCVLTMAFFCISCCCWVF